MEGFCPACGTQRADGAGFCAQCGHRFDIAVSEPASEPVPAGMAAAQEPPAAVAVRPRHRYTLGQKLFLGLFLIGFMAVSWVWIEAKVRARHPQWHHYR